MSEAKALSAVLALYTSDAVLKKYLMHHLKEGEEKEILHGKAVLHPLKNPGAILGMGKEHPGKLNGVVTAMLGIVGLRLWKLSEAASGRYFMDFKQKKGTWHGKSRYDASGCRWSWQSDRPCLSGVCG